MGLPLSGAALDAFRQLIHAFVSPAVLRHFDPALPTLVETDSSGFAVAGILSQRHVDGYRPVAFWSRQMTETERRYGAHDGELLAVVESVRHWTTLLESCQAPFVIFSDHQALQHFQQSQRLLPRHISWSQDLNTHKYEIQYRPARGNCKADALSRRPDFQEPTAPYIDSIVRPTRILPVEVLTLHSPDSGPISPHTSPKPTAISPCSRLTLKLHPPVPTTVSPRTSPIPAAVSPRSQPIHVPPTVPLDPFLQQIATACLSDPVLSRRPRPAHFSPAGIDPVLFHNIVYVPPDENIRSAILALAHDSLAAGHPGRDRTIDLVRRSFNWPGLPDDVRRYVGSCDTCQKAKTSHRRPPGLLKPLPVPERPWSSVTWDYIGPLPDSSNGVSTFNAILVIVDRFTKLAHFVPANTTDNARALARALALKCAALSSGFILRLRCFNFALFAVWDCDSLCPATTVPHAIN